MKKRLDPAADHYYVARSADEKLVYFGYGSPDRWSTQFYALRKKLGFDPHVAGYILDPQFSSRDVWWFLWTDSVDARATRGLFNNTYSVERFVSRLTLAPLTDFGLDFDYPKRPYMPKGGGLQREIDHLRERLAYLEAKLAKSAKKKDA